MSDKDKRDNPAFDIPEDAVSPGTILPRPARADTRSPDVRAPHVQAPDISSVETNPADANPADAGGATPIEPQPREPVLGSPVETPVATQPASAPDKEATVSIRPDPQTNPSARSKPRLGRSLLGLCLAAAIGAAAVLAYQHWAPEPETETFAACLDRTVPGLESADSGRLHVILTPLINDQESIQQNLIRSALDTFQGSDAPLMQVQSVDCSPVEATGSSVLGLASKAIENSLEISRRTSADVLVWGEILPENQRLELRANYAASLARTHFSTDQMSLKTDFGAEQAAVLAAKIWSASNTTENLDADVISAGMTKARDALLPISENAQPDLSVRQLGSLYHALGDAEYVLSLQTEKSGGLESAVEHYRSARELFERYTFPNEWARVQNDLGVALATLGMRDNQNQDIGLAVSELQEAVVETPRSRDPVLWAQLQGHLGEALNGLGTREANNQFLADSVAAYRRALTIYDLEEFPVEWATTQHNLGAALQALGQRDGDPAILQDAVAAYQSSLEIRTAQDFPRDHAITQINLGSALMTVGARAENSEMVKEAANAYRAAIDQLDKEASVIEWATAQHSLGNALALIAEQDNTIDDLDEALIAFSLALDSFDRQTDPTRWAVTQNNIGNVLHTLGDRRKDPEAISAAIAAYEAAVSVLSETAPAYAERVVESLSRAQVLQQSIAQTN